MPSGKPTWKNGCKVGQIQLAVCTGIVRDTKSSGITSGKYVNWCSKPSPLPRVATRRPLTKTMSLIASPDLCRHLRGFLGQLCD